MIQPTVGRVVWFYCNEAYAKKRGMERWSDQPMAALVAYVHGERMVNLDVSDHNGEQFGVTSVTLVQEGDAPAPAGAFYCTWMPFQQGQAKAQAQATESATGDAPVRVFLNRGATLKLDGLPVELEHDTVVHTHAGNVALFSRAAVAVASGELND